MSSNPSPAGPTDQSGLSVCPGTPLVATVTRRPPAIDLAGAHFPVCVVRAAATRPDVDQISQLAGSASAVAAGANSVQPAARTFPQPTRGAWHGRPLSRREIPTPPHPGPQQWPLRSRAVRRPCQGSDLQPDG